MQGRDRTVCFYLTAYHAALLVPFFVAGIFAFADAPIFLPHIFNAGNTGGDSDGSHNVFQVTLLLIDWAWLVIGILQNTFTLCTLSMPFCGIRLALRSLRTYEQRPGLARLDQRELHVQLELLGRMLDNLIRHLTPLLYLIVLLIPVFCNVLIATTLLNSSEMGDRYPLALSSMVAWSIGGTLSGIGALRVAGSVRQESLQVLEAVHQAALTHTGFEPERNNGVVCRGGSGRRKNIAVARILASRRPLQLYMGHFRVFGGRGDAAAYVLSVLENTVNLVFMVDAQSKVYLVFGTSDSG